MDVIPRGPELCETKKGAVMSFFKLTIKKEKKTSTSYILTMPPRILTSQPDFWENIVMLVYRQGSRTK